MSRSYKDVGLYLLLLLQVPLLPLDLGHVLYHHDRGPPDPGAGVNHGHMDQGAAGAAVNRQVL